MQVTPNGPEPLHEKDAVIRETAPGDEQGGRPGGRIKAGGVRVQGLRPGVPALACRAATGAHALRMSHSLTVVSPEPDEASRLVWGMNTTDVMLWGSPDAWSLRPPPRPEGGVLTGCRML